MKIADKLFFESVIMYNYVLLNTTIIKSKLFNC
jgi:hypothetical protein